MNNTYVAITNGEHYKMAMTGTEQKFVGEYHVTELRDIIGNAMAEAMIADIQRHGVNMTDCKVLASDNGSKVQKMIEEMEVCKSPMTNAAFEKMGGDDQWKYLVENRDADVVITLDDEDTYVDFQHRDENTQMAKMDHWLGYTPGAASILEALGFEVEYA